MKNQNSLAKHYIPVATLSPQYNAKVFEQLETGFKRTINWKNYLKFSISKNTIS